MEIADWRKKIDEIDLQMLGLLNERARAAHAIGLLKRGNQAPIYEGDRERAIFAKLQEANHGPLTNEDITLIYTQIIAIMRDLQTRP